MHLQRCVGRSTFCEDFFDSKNARGQFREDLLASGAAFGDKGAIEFDGGFRVGLTFKFARFGLLTATLILTCANFASAEKREGQQAPAEAFALPVPERVGVFQHPVIYVSTEVRVQKVSRKVSKVLQRLVVQWGLHVFEVGDAVYECTTVADCEFVDFLRRATYELCEVKDHKVSCSKKISGDNGPGGDSTDPTIHDTFNVEPERSGSWEGSEFPERSYDPDGPVP